MMSLGTLRNHEAIRHTPAKQRGFLHQITGTSTCGSSFASLEYCGLISGYSARLVLFARNNILDKVLEPADIPFSFASTGLERGTQHIAAVAAVYLLVGSHMFTRDEVLNQIIPYRLDAIAALNLVLSLRKAWGAPRPMKIYIDDRLQITGNSSAFTNPVIEAGVIHCRALLEFLGLRVSPNDPTKLIPRGCKSRGDDWVIEDFANAAGALPPVTPQQAVSRYKGDPVEAEKALASVLHTANKGLAHLTAGLSAAATEINALEIASRGVPALVISHLYTPLGLAAPKTSISSTRRDDC